jgi:hypothetical protein
MTGLQMQAYSLAGILAKHVFVQGEKQFAR